MNPFQALVFLIFVLPAIMIKDGWQRLTKNMTKAEKKEFIWRIPYILIAILVFLSIILWAKGYR
ncbi:MAG: hypothetical protein WCI93_03405 [bacterium]